MKQTASLYLKLPLKTAFLFFFIFGKLSKKLIHFWIPRQNYSMEGDDVGMNRIMFFKWVSSIIFIIQAVQINATTVYAIEWKRSLNLP